MSEALAVLNAGSSSIKFALYASADETLLFRGQVEKIGVAPQLRVSNGKGERVIEKNWPAEGFDHRAATRVVLETGRELLSGSRVVAVGHRVVHGGPDYAAPMRITPSVAAALAKLAPLAPLHQPHNLAPIEAVAEAAPELPQVACFDTAFHRAQPELAQLFALPRKYADAGVRRYGFHGLSYEYVTSRLREIEPELARGRVIVAHLGNGASLCAVRDGVSVASTMGFTAVDGLMMGTRCGAIDPGVLIYLMDEYGLDARGLENLIYKQSGLLGVSGVTSDMRGLRESAAPEARLTIALFVYRIVREIGSMAAALGGIDGLVFTGGIGENDAEARADIAAGCAWLRVQLDEAHNASKRAGRINSATSRVAVLIVPTDEERMMARHTARVLRL